MCMAAGLPLDGHSYCVPTRYSYHYSQIFHTRSYATNLAIKITKANDEYALVTMASSRDARHRVSAAFALGMQKRHDDTLYKLMMDTDPLVSQAAREAAVYININKYKRKEDFGPLPCENDDHKKLTAAAWKEHFVSLRSP